MTELPDSQLCGQEVPTTFGLEMHNQMGNFTG